jgi:dihydrofolate reductase
MRKLIYYFAASLDGYIAGPRGQTDFFPLAGEILAEYPETVPVHARGPLGVAGAANRHFDTVIMGRGTYEPALGLGVTSPYPHLRQYVVSTTLATAGPQVEIVGGDPAALVRDLKKRDGLDVWLAGGGILAAALLPEIDELIIRRSPQVICSGVPLFDGPFIPTVFSPTARRDLGSGLSITIYHRGAYAGKCDHS